jgi:phospholipid/cholesterol/gamma-HCH transport system ATP-binding protein
MPEIAPVLELAQAHPASWGDLAVDAPLSLRLLPGDFAVIEGTNSAQLAGFADLCIGVVELRAGQVWCMGHDWATLPHTYAAAVRGSIGRTFVRGGWIPFLDIETNILLPQLHHTRRGRTELLGEAIFLSQQFGLPGLPQGHASDLSVTDLTSAALVRALLGEPKLLLIEPPELGLPYAIFAPLLNRIEMVRDRGGAVIWFSLNRSGPIERVASVTHRLSLTEQGLESGRHRA